MNVNLVNNSYFVSSNSNEKFNQHLVTHLPKNQLSNINWYQKNQGNPLHCTLGFFFSKAQQSTDAAIQKIVQQEIANFPHSIHLKVEDCDITKNGWAILKFKPNSKLKQLHQNILNAVVGCGLQPSQFSGNNFMAHVSIGKLKANANQQAALTELQTVCQSLKNNPFPFVAYDIHMSKAVNKSNMQLIHKNLDRRDLGIQKVNTVAKNKIVEISNVQGANKFAKMLNKYYGIGSSKQPGPKIVKFNGTNYTVLLTQQQFDQAKGHFNNLI